MEERVQLLADSLRAAGLRCTTPRLRLVRMLVALPGHFSAEEVFRQVKANPQAPVSRATIYRFLSELERLGLLRRAQLAEGHSHYELAEAQPEHCHLVCAQCGRLVEVSSADLQRRVRRLACEQGFSAGAAAVQVTLSSCQHCREAADSLPEPRGE